MYEKFSVVGVISAFIILTIFTVSNTYIIYTGIVEISSPILPKKLRFIAEVYIISTTDGFNVNVLLQPSIRKIENLVKLSITEYINQKGLNERIEILKDIIITYTGKRSSALLKVELLLKGTGSYYIPSKELLTILIVIAVIVSVLAIKTIVKSEEYRIT